MKKLTLRILSFIGLLIILALALNINVTTRQGVNYQVRVIRIPLYLKILDFVDRDFNYKQLVKGIVDKRMPAQERVMKLFAWTRENIRKVPEGLPIIDDHVLNIIIRNYGTADQSSDVFTVLCNYAGIDAFYTLVSGQHQAQGIIPLSFVKLHGKWFIFDPYRGVYFKDALGNGLADTETLKSTDSWQIVNTGGAGLPDYRVYFKNLPTIKKMQLTRANIQSPLRRIIFEFKKVIQRK